MEPTPPAIAMLLSMQLFVVGAAAEPEPEPPVIQVPEPPPVVQIPEPPLPPVEREIEIPTTTVPTQPEPSDATDADAEPPALEAPVRGTRTSTPRTPTLRGLARVEARAGAGLLPQVDLGGAATLGLDRRWLRIELSAARWLPRERTVAPEVAVRASAWALELRGCAALRPRPWLAVLPCAELDVGGLRGEGRGAGLVSPRITRQPWLALGVGSALSLRLHRRVSAWLGATAVFPVLRPGLGLEGTYADLYRVGGIAGRGSLGVEVYFP